MGRKVPRVKYMLDMKQLRSPSRDKIGAILRRANELILKGGKNLPLQNPEGVT